MLDQQINLFTITDLKQFIYCPRIFYYHACLPGIRPVTFKMEAGISAHEQESKRAARRSLAMYDELAGQRAFDVSVQSDALGLTGIIDEVVTTDDGRLIPVDYKLAHKAGHHFKVQLAAYSLLLESNLEQPVTYGYLYLIRSRQVEQIRITPRLRQTVMDALQSMHQITNGEQMPSPTTWRQRCPDCEFRRFCNDV